MTNSDTNNFNGQRVITTEIQQTDYFSLNPVKKTTKGVSRNRIIIKTKHSVCHKLRLALEIESNFQVKYVSEPAS